jgi:hypothetical protein
MTYGYVPVTVVPVWVNIKSSVGSRVAWFAVLHVVLHVPFHEVSGVPGGDGGISVTQQAVITTRPIRKTRIMNHDFFIISLLIIGFINVITSVKIPCAPGVPKGKKEI